jgi:hypothetical protein
MNRGQALSRVLAFIEWNAEIYGGGGDFGNDDGRSYQAK